MKLFGTQIPTLLLSGIVLVLAHAGAVSATVCDAKPAFNVAETSPLGSQYGEAKVIPAFGTHLENYRILANQSSTFFMPIDVNSGSGYLQNNATTQSLSIIEGMLCISINDAWRSEMLLHPEMARWFLRIVSPPGYVLQDRLVVSFNLKGEAQGTDCGTQQSVEPSALKETANEIQLALKQPNSDLRGCGLRQGEGRDALATSMKATTLDRSRLLPRQIKVAICTTMT